MLWSMTTAPDIGIGSTAFTGRCSLRQRPRNVIPKRACLGSPQDLLKLLANPIQDGREGLHETAGRWGRAARNVLDQAFG